MHTESIIPALVVIGVALFILPMPRNTLSIAASLLIGYICGLLLAPDLFSTDITATHWDNIWVYVWLLLWPLGLLIKLAIVLGYIVAIIAVGVLLAMGVGWLFASRKQY